MTPSSIPVFLKNAGIGVPYGKSLPQIRGFDVFYKSPIVVGFHIIGSKAICNELPLMGQEIAEENSPKIVGFYCFGRLGISEDPLEFTVNEKENSPKVLGFYAFEVSNDTIGDIGMMAQETLRDNQPQIISFYAIQSMINL